MDYIKYSLCKGGVFPPPRSLQSVQYILVLYCMSFHKICHGKWIHETFQGEEAFMVGSHWRVEVVASRKFKKVY